MKRRLLILSTICLTGGAGAQSPKFDDLAKEVGKLPGATGAGATKGAGDDTTNIAGMRGRRRSGLRARAMRCSRAATPAPRSVRTTGRLS